MPKWGLAMTEGTLASWHVQPGERVAAGQPLCDIETAKIANEFEAPFEGIVARLLAQPGDIIPVGRAIAVVATEDAGAEEIEAAVAEEASADRVDTEVSSGPEIRSLQMDHGTLAYLETGDGPSAPVVLVHGFGGSHASWAMSQGVLCAARRTVAFDLPGHGGSSPGPDSGSPQELAEILDDALGKLGLSGIHLVAHSYGGIVALALARLNPSRVAACTFIAPMGFGSRPNADFVRGFAASERKRDLRPVLETLFAVPATLSREMVNDTLAAFREEGPRLALRKMADAVLDCPAGTANPPELAGVPHQVIWGDSDRVMAIPNGLESALGARFHLIAAAGHMPQIEAADTVNRLIENFVR
jgi:pyruvate dehydrogenase E2 component (dihydrolipoamide acetyltransferase)